MLCCRQQPADSQLGELRRNREIPSLVSQVLTATAPAAAVPEPLVTGKSLCSAGKHLSHHGGNLQLRQPCWSQSELSLPGIASHLLHGTSFSGAIRHPPGHKPVQPAVGEPASAGGWTGSSPEAPPKPSHSMWSVLSPVSHRVILEPAGSPRDREIHSLFKTH